MIQWSVPLSKGCPLEPVKSIPIDNFIRIPEEIKSKNERFSLNDELSYIERIKFFEIGNFNWILLLLLFLSFVLCNESILLV